MAMKLIGLFDSPYVRRVAVSMRLQGFAFEHVALSVFRNQEEMRKLNPLVKVPMLVLDNGEKLIESSFILDYLDDEAGAGKRLIPASGPARRAVLQRCAIALVGAEKAVQIVYDTRQRPSEFSYAPWVARCRAQMHEAFSMLDAMGWDGEGADGALTQAGITAVCALGFARHVHGQEFPRGRYPNLDRLAERCEALPAFRDTPLE